MLVEESSKLSDESMVFEYKSDDNFRKYSDEFTLNKSEVSQSFLFFSQATQSINESSSLQL
jgi:hypothetical protein